MIAIDTNVLVHAHRGDSAWHETAVRRLRTLVEAGDRWAIPWPCVHEFFAVVTNPRIWKSPTPTKNTLEQIESWMESPSLTLLAEGPTHWRQLKRTLESGQVLGPQVHDARIAVLCLQHGVRTLWTLDRDFSRFPTLKTVNPLIH